VPDEVVGRVVELAAVERFVEGAGRGLAALVLEGEPGIGKTTIWEAALDAASHAGFSILRSRPARSEHGLTLGGLTDLFDGVDATVLDRLPDPQRHALEVALLRVAPSGTLPDQRALSVAVAGALRLLTATTPVLLAIDDAQWLDASSAAILEYAVRRLVDRPVGLLASVRADGGEPGLPDLRSAVSPDRSDRIRVGPLPLASLHRMFQLRLGRSFPRLVLVRIEAVSGGNPLYALEIARALADVDIPTDPHARLPVPDSLASLMAGRISALPVRSRDAMLLAAAAAVPTLDTIERARPGAAAALGPAARDGVVELEDGEVRFRHPLFAQAVLGLARPEELRRAHAALAGATTSADAQARHLGLAADGPDESVAQALVAAAAGARGRGATLDAAALYLEAVQVTPADRADRRLERARLAAECLFVDLSEMVQADRILETAIDGAPPGPGRAEALSLRALVRYYHGRVPEAIAMGEQALAEAGSDAPLRARVLGRLAFLVMQLDLERGLTLVEEATALLDRHPGPVDPDLLANALLLRAVAELALVRPVRRADLERGRRLITRDGRSWEREGADGSMFGLARLTDDLDQAIEQTRELIQAKSGPGGDDPFNLVQLSGLLVFRGEWAEARGVAEAALEGYEREGADVHPAWGLRGVALVAAYQGRLDEARRWADEGLRVATDRGDVVIAAFHRHILGFVALSLGEWAESDRQLSEAAALAARVAVRHPGRFKLAGDQVEAALALGDLPRAAAIVGTLVEAGRIAPTPWVLAVGARSSALLAAARGDLGAALVAFDRASLEHERLHMPFERARTLLLRGQVHRRRREKRLADETLRAALALFEDLGALVWADRARTELARVGLRPRAPDELTETERRVAELAAQGLSSRQIAEQAFLAPKTVGNVLGRVYEKLRIHTRAELGAVMASRRSPGSLPDDRRGASATGE
jgi:DNA-binding CsgD family transcriptional regulator